MAQPVVHFEIIGQDPAALRAFYGRLFGWEFDIGGPVADEVSEQGSYGFTFADSSAGVGIPGGVGGGIGYPARTLFYVGVPDIDAVLDRVESLGGTRVSGPHGTAESPLRVAFFRDNEGHLVGLASTE